MCKDEWIRRTASWRHGLRVELDQLLQLSTALECFHCASRGGKKDTAAASEDDMGGDAGKEQGEPMEEPADVDASSNMSAESLTPFVSSDPRCMRGSPLPLPHSGRELILSKRDMVSRFRLFIPRIPVPLSDQTLDANQLTAISFLLGLRRLDFQLGSLCLRSIPIVRRLMARMKERIS